MLMLTFSYSGWTNVCLVMSHKADTPAVAHSSDHANHHHSDSHSHSKHTPADDTGSNHCQHVSSCASTTMPRVILREAADVSHAEPVRSNDSRPSSQSPDLEPPPPKA